MSKQQAGSKGGKTTFQRHGREHFRKIGKAGARVTWSRYHLAPIGQSGWAMVDRQTNAIKAVISLQIGE